MQQPRLQEERLWEDRVFAVRRVRWVSGRFHGGVARRLGDNRRRVCATVKLLVDGLRTAVTGPWSGLVKNNLGAACAASSSLRQFVEAF
ncbi:Uncharacterised protein [Mycobacteroides abscessus subsp. abscessus]|nr:Uncharacterised protein [Mycobacteroides abscessus subsp. abscessus]